jgi:outer membrane protein assembly factor BamA
VSIVYEWKLSLFSQKEKIEKTFFEGENLFRFVEKELAACVNQGFPFARVEFDTIRYLDMQIVEIEAKISPGPVVLHGGLINEGDSSISSGLISRALRIKRGQVFSFSRFQMIPDLLGQLNFAEAAENPKLQFFGNQALVKVNLIKRRANTFTGILGILPQSEAGGGTLITGNIDLGLINLFNQGIGFKAKWNRFAPQSQVAEVNLEAPFLNYSGFGIEAGFDIFRQDSTINRRNFDFRFLTSPSGKWQYQFGIKSNFSSGFLTLSQIQKVNQSTQYLSFSLIRKYPLQTGVELRKRQFSFHIFPAIKSISTTVSPKKTLPQIETSLFWKYPISFGTKRFAIQTSLALQSIFSGQITLQDQYRVGGNRSIRGFVENFFYTSQHVLVSFQPQFLVDRSLLVGLFTDLFFFNHHLDNQALKTLDFAMGFGFATEVDLGNNFVQISIANGFMKDFLFDIQTTKIHFGYIARF